MATKIKDGLFIGDAEASQDPEFIELNKITFVINCAGRQLPNLWEQHGLHYLTFPWTSDPDCTLFDGGNVVIEQITSFIDEALEKGDSVLVHSLEGTGRCIACVTAYLMFRHHWSFEKALDFLCNKRPDAAPNAGFVQQLYRLDLRLCERRYGQNKEPAEEERIRHDQWIPLVPGVAPGGQKRTQGFQVAESLASSGATQGKNAISTVIADAAAGRFGGAASMFPSLGRLTEVQEEEIVLVNSFLNSQPQIDALPPGRADYEDHVSKELHWIDRPRIDKLTAAGRHDHGNERRQHMIPVSPRTGRAVPERPGNSSYNALSRGNNKGLASNQAPSTLVGILKTARKVEQSTTHSRGQKNPSAIPALESEACELGLTPSGDTTAAVSGVGGAGGAPVASPSLSSSRRAAGTLKVDDEVVIEDLSEPQSDRWSGGDGGTEGCGLSEHETASGGETSSRGQAQGSGFSPEDGTDISSFAEVDERNVRPDVAAKAERQSSSFERGGQGMRGPVAPARPEERQAWDGASSGSKGRSYGRAQADEPRGEAGLNSVTKVKESETAKGGPPRATSTLTSYDGDRKHFQKSAANVGGRTAAAAAARVATVAGTAAQPKPKPLRRGGSEGSLKHSAADISARISTTPNLLQQDKTRLPQAPGRKGAAKHSGKAPPSGLPGPGWGPDDVRRDDVGAGGQQSQLEPEAGVPTAGDGAQGKGQGGWGRKASESRLYAGLEGGGSLQQLAQTPNPQQRRLPSPRPQQELGQTHQGDLRQGSSEADSIFSQQRPSSAPPQRPDPSEDDNIGNGGSGGSGGGGIAAANSVSANKAGVGRTLASSSVGAAIQGYPAHGLMPSGTAVQISANNDRSGRKGAAASSGNASGGGTGVARPRLSSRSQDLPVGGKGGSGGQRDTLTTFGNGKGGGGGGRAFSAMEEPHLARISPDEAMDAEQQRLANAHRPRRDRGSNAGSLPRGIRTSQSTPPPPADSSRARIGSPAPSMTSDRSFGQGYSSSELNPPHGNRRVPGVTPHAAAPRTKTTGVVRPKAGTLPLPSRRVPSRSSGRDGSDRAGIGGESVRWANPAPRARQRHDHGQGFSGTYGYSGSAEPRGETGGGSVSSRTVDAYAHLSHGGGSGPQKYDGSGQQRHSSRAGGAPIYRSGSPAPVRGRKSVANAESSRFSYQQKSRGLDKSRPQAFGIPPGFRGYMASTTGGSGGGGGGASDRRTTTRRSQIPTTTATDRGRRHSSGSDGSTPSSGVPRASLVAGRSAGQRPSTSEGLGSGSSAGRRGRSASPAPRPNSASGRRRSASPSPASLYSGKIDSFARPRWV